MKDKSERKEKYVHITFKERMGENRRAYRILVGKNIKEREHLEDQSEDGIILNGI